MDNYKPANKHDFTALYSSLVAWYGEDRARNEITAYCPEPVNAADTAEKLLRKVAPATIISRERIKNHWEDIAGKQLTMFTTPIGLKNRCLYVEVKHPAWLRELKGTVKDILIDKINNLCGRTVCKDIIFIPPGR